MPAGESPVRPAVSRDPSDITLLLTAWRGGDAAAFDRLVAALYDELRRIARRCMAGERAGHSLQPTALVNEAYLRLIDAQRVNWQNRNHFLAVAARQRQMDTTGRSCDRRAERWAAIPDVESGSLRAARGRAGALL